MNYELRMKKFKEDTCKELVTKKFAEAMKTLIGVNFEFDSEAVMSRPKGGVLM